MLCLRSINSNTVSSTEVSSTKRVRLAIVLDSDLKKNCKRSTWGIGNVIRHFYRTFLNGGYILIWCIWKRIVRATHQKRGIEWSLRASVRACKHGVFLYEHEHWKKLALRATSTFQKVTPLKTEHASTCKVMRPRANEQLLKFYEHSEQKPNFASTAEFW